MDIMTNKKKKTKMQDQNIGQQKHGGQEDLQEKKSAILRVANTNARKFLEA